MSAYNITHCIYCGKKGFKDVDAVIEHVKEKHNEDTPPMHNETQKEAIQVNEQSGDAEAAKPAEKKKRPRLVKRHSWEFKEKRESAKHKKAQKLKALHHGLCQS